LRGYGTRFVVSSRVQFAPEWTRAAFRGRGALTPS